MSIRSVRIFAFALVFLAISAGAVQASRLVSYHQAGASLGSDSQVFSGSTSTPEPPTQEVHIVGTVSAINGTVWTINGKTVTVDAQTRIGGSPVVGDTVSVEAALQPDGSFLASEIEKKPLDILNTPEVKPTETSEKDDDQEKATPGVTSTPGAKMNDDQDEQGEQDAQRLPALTRMPGSSQDDDQEMKDSQPAQGSRHSGGEKGSKKSGHHHDD